MKRITFILALVFITTLAFSGLKETQKWLKKHGKSYSIKELKNLKELDLRRTKVSDISPLKGLKNLKSLMLNGTKVRYNVAN